MSIGATEDGSVSERDALDLHRRLRGKIEVAGKVELSEEILELVYTPGVGAVSRLLARDPDCAAELTGRGNAVAVVSDGSAVLGLDGDGSLEDALDGADAVIGLSGPGAFTLDDLGRMAERPIMFALANPEPEVNPDEARERGAGVVASGRSDFPNQVNNVLAFPGLFRGLLDARLHELDRDRAVRAAKALSALVSEPAPEKILPGVLDERIVPAVAKAVAEG